jgi:hypothetical protein
MLALEVIPCMSTSMAVLLLKETSEWEQISPCTNKPKKRAMTFLQDYCMFYLTKNLPVILRQDRRRLAEFSEEYIWELVRLSFSYLVDSKADLDVVLQFAADTLTIEKSVYELFDKVHSRVQNCCGFDSQSIAKIDDL